MRVRVCLCVSGCGAVSLLSAACEWVFLCLSRIRHVVCRNAGRHLTKEQQKKNEKKSAEHLHIAEGNCLKRRKTKGISLCIRTTMLSYFKGETHSCTAHSAIWCRVAASLDKSWVYKIWNQSQRRRQKYSIYILGISCVCVMQMSSNIPRLPPIGSVLQSICMPGEFS